VAIARAEQQRAERKALARRPQSSPAQLLSQLGIHLNGGGLADAFAIVAATRLAVFRGCLVHLFNRLKGRQDKNVLPATMVPDPEAQV
jgi:hypothetical protein